MPSLALFRFDLVGLVCAFPILELNDYVCVSGVMTVVVSVITLIQISEWDSACCANTRLKYALVFRFMMSDCQHDPRRRLSSD
jgi:hypothetical protein